MPWWLAYWYDGGRPRGCCCGWPLLFIASEVDEAAADGAAVVACVEALVGTVEAVLSPADEDGSDEAAPLTAGVDGPGWVARFECILIRPKSSQASESMIPKASASRAALGSRAS